MAYGICDVVMVYYSWNHKCTEITSSVFYSTKLFKIVTV